MKPIAVINASKVPADGTVPNLHKAGYEIIWTTDGPSVTLHSPPQSQRERLAAAAITGLLACDWGSGTESLAAEAAVLIADALIERLNK